MPRVLSYTPQWLARPSPGHELFSPKPTSGKSTTAQGKGGKRKTIATRNSEVFVAVGTEIRWADLAALKEGTGSYRTLKVSVPLPITQLVIAPSGDYMAVSTAHTVHVVILPDSSLLDSQDAGPAKLKTFQVGPTAHVREESPVVSLLWHPLGYRGHCLVTITQDGVVRLWEVNRSDRSTFSEPALSIDLQKLANATSDQEDLSASKYGASKGFSPDSFELEVASACFGDFPDQEGVHGWAPMSLWVAMTEGDVYALCPLLPSKWQLLDSPGADTITQTLATSINSNFADIEEAPDASPEEKVVAEKQYSWLSDITYQEPLKEDLPNGDAIKVFTRPASVSAVPLLQGPFSTSSDVDDFEISDMIVFSLKTFTAATEEDPAAEGLPAAVVCLLTDTSKVHICLDLEGVVGRWLPSSTGEYAVVEYPRHDLVITETVALTNDQTSSFNQSITTDIHTDFSFFVSHANGVYYVSMEKWIRKLEEQLAEAQTEGADFRLTRIMDSASTQVELSISQPARSGPTRDISEEEVMSCVVMEDGNVGYLLLTKVNNEPQAVIFDAPEDGLPTEEELAEYMDIGTLPPHRRATYQPPRELYEPLQFLTSVDQIVPARHQTLSKEEIRLSPANLDILMNVHKALSQDTHKLQTAVTDLFRRCERLREEFRDQIFRTASLTTKIDTVTGNDEYHSEGDSDAYGSGKIDDRMKRVQTRQDELNARYEAIRRKMAGIGGSELSEKEAEFVDELQTMDIALDSKQQTLTADPEGADDTPLWKRLDKVKDLKKDLTKQVAQAQKTEKAERPASNGVKVPSQSRKLENEQIEALLQRETALVEAATRSLRSMGISIPLEAGS